VQFYLDEEGDIRYDLIDRKHYDPVRRQLLRNQGDQEGIPIDTFENMLFVGTERGLGIFSELLPAVLYKRGSISDWAQFCNVFGMPIREYTYDAGDEDARRRLIADARRQGVNAVYIHPRDSELNLVESGNKTGSSDLYLSFVSYWDNEMSIRILGNTLTTDAKATGTQALGTIHKEEEEDMNAVDRDYILDVLNYDMAPIFSRLGFNVEGGEFVYVKPDRVDLAQQLQIVQGLKGMGLPMDDDWLYTTFGVEKPKDYDRQKAEAEAQSAAIRSALTDPEPDDRPSPKPDAPKDPRKSTVKDRLRGFFGLAPHTGADTDF
jgi:phage gp29-like protein